MSAAIRVYLPLSLRQLNTLWTDRTLSTPELPGFAVTPRLLSTLGSIEDDESGEYAALQEAAFQVTVQGGRVVVAADVDAAQVDAQVERVPGASAALVVVRGGLALRRVVSLQVLDPMDQRDPGTELDLSWYDVTELPQLLSSLE